MISLDKTYTTRQGRPVRIYAVDGEGAKPVHGAYFSHDDQWVSLTWSNSGRFLSGGDGGLDLIEVEAPVNEVLEALKFYVEAMEAIGQDVDYGREIIAKAEAR